MNNTLENSKKTGYVVSLIYRLPKKNHDAIVELSKKYVDMFTQYGVLRHDVFQLIKADNDVPEFIHLDKVVSANLEDEEVWVETMHYKDKNHWLEARSKMEKDTNCQQGWQEFANLLTSSSSVICDEFIRLKGIGIE
jgi:uncharacterized protein YbaA (DUF1428 family)